MNKLIALCYFVLSLYGCDVGNSTFVHRARTDGADTLHARSVVEAGVARFECLRSASGRCYYTVFPRDCAAPSAAARASGNTRSDRCRAEPLDRFALAAGDSRQIAGLHRFRPCVSERDETPGPDCDLPASVAAR